MKDKLLNLISKSPVTIGQWEGYSLLTDLHNEWLREFLFSTEDVSIQAHRGSYKTTVLGLFFALHVLTAPDELLLYARKTDSDVKEVMKTTQNILRSGAFQRLAKELYGVPLLLTKETANEVSTNLQRSIKGAPQILGVGCGSSITGKHADVVVTDDIVNLKDRVSRAEREHTKAFYMELQNVKNRGGRFINCGTPWHKEDAFLLMPNLQKFDCYSTGLIDRDTLNEIRAAMTDSLFAANYELKHIADEGALFKDPNFIKDYTRIYDGVAHIDAAYGGSDYTAYTVMKKHEDGTITAYGKLYSKHVSECLTDIGALQERYKAGTIYNEDNGDKGFLNRELQTVGLIGKKYHESQNKYLKISSYLKKNWNKIYWLEDTDPEYLNQVLDYTEHAAHDDAPDSAASLLRALEKGGVKLKTFAGGI